MRALLLDAGSIIQDYYNSGGSDGPRFGDPPKDELHWAIVIAVGVLPFAAAIVGWRVYVKYYIKPWSQGVFPKRTRYKERNVMDAFRILAAHLVHLDKAGSKDGVIMATQYLRRRFPEYKHLMSINTYSRHGVPVAYESVVEWLSEKAVESVKAQVVDFLADLAYSNAHCTEREYTMIRRVGKGLNLDDSDVHSILRIREHRFKQHRKRTKQRGRTEGYSPSHEYGELESAYRILGVNVNAPFADVKKAFRRLAKLHHPDMFASMSESQQRMANERFSEIAAAYESIEQLQTIRGEK